MQPWLKTENETLFVGNSLDVLKTIPNCSVQCVVTSPPYWALRDYGVEGQLGLEKTPEEFIANMVEVFREVRRVLRDDGTCWINIGDSYAGSGCGGYVGGKSTLQGSIDGQEQAKIAKGSQKHAGLHERKRLAGAVGRAWNPPPEGIKQKNLIGIPWMLAFALRADGWYLRSEIIWHKRSPMPESVKDRPTKSHEQIFLLTKSPRYFYDVIGSQEAAISGPNGSRFNKGKSARVGQSQLDRTDSWITPTKIVGELFEFDLDPCACIPQPWPCAKHQFTIEDDGLSKEWFGRVWLNPPYSNAEKWLEKLADHGNGIALIFARTETEMFCSHVWEKATAIKFIAGRLFFHHPDGKRAKGNSGGPSVLVAYGQTNADILRNSIIPGYCVEGWWKTCQSH